MVVEPIERSGTTLAEIAYERISEALLSGRLEPGARLVMDNLAGEFNISRTPVRDALRRLEREGVVTAKDRQGYVVRQMGRRDADELYEARISVEGFAASKVAERGESAISHVAEAIDGCERVTVAGHVEIFHANMRIHRSIVEATGNSVLVDLFDAIWYRGRGFALFADYLAQHMDQSSNIVESHRPLLDVLRAGRLEAFEGVRKHIEEGRSVHARH